MVDVQNIYMVTSIIDNFMWSDLKSIYSFTYHIIENEFYEQTYCLDIEFILLHRNMKNYKVQIRFRGVENVTICFEYSLIQLGLFQIVNIKDDGWCSLNYLVRDLENDDCLKFYCNQIEVVKVEESNVTLP